MYFSCSCKKSTKRTVTRGAVSRAQLRAKSCLRQLRYARACGRSRAPHTPPCVSPVRIESALEHLNLHPVQAENVPIFCLKDVVLQVCSVFWRCGGRGSQGRAHLYEAPPLCQLLWLLSCLAQESNIVPICTDYSQNCIYFSLQVCYNTGKWFFIAI